MHQSTLVWVIYNVVSDDEIMTRQISPTSRDEMREAHGRNNVIKSGVSKSQKLSITTS